MDSNKKIPKFFNNPIALNKHSEFEWKNRNAKIFKMPLKTWEEACLVSQVSNKIENSVKMSLWSLHLWLIRSRVKYNLCQF